MIDYFDFADLYLSHFGRCDDYADICPEKLKYITVASPGLSQFNIHWCFIRYDGFVKYIIIQIFSFIRFMLKCAEPMAIHTSHSKHCSALDTE